MDPANSRTTDAKLAKLHWPLTACANYREIPGQLVSAFLFIASHDGCHLQALTDEMGLETASRSRVTDWLSDYHRLTALELITKTVDPANRRRRVLRLTSKGQALADRFKRPVDGLNKAPMAHLLAGA